MGNKATVRILHICTPKSPGESINFAIVRTVLVLLLLVSLVLFVITARFSVVMNWSLTLQYAVFGEKVKLQKLYTVRLRFVSF